MFSAPINGNGGYHDQYYFGINCVFFLDGVKIREGSRESCEWVWSVIGGRVPPCGVCPLSILPAAGQVPINGDTATQAPTTLRATGKCEEW